MIRGILQSTGPKEEGKPTPETLVFVCPGCGSRHAIFVSSIGHPTTDSYYNIGPYHVWLFKTVRGGVIQVYPSFDASEICGYHGPSAWEVEVMTASTPEADNAWLADGLKAPN